MSEMLEYIIKHHIIMQISLLIINKISLQYKCAYKPASITRSFAYSWQIGSS